MTEADEPKGTNEVYRRMLLPLICSRGQVKIEPSNTLIFTERVRDVLVNAGVGDIAFEDAGRS